MIRGEYWIKGGDIEFADGDVGDSNHESIVIQNAIADIIGRLDFSLGESPDGELLRLEFGAYHIEKYGYAPDPDEEDDRLRDELIHQCGFKKEEAESLVNVAYDRTSGDPRDHAMRYWKWQWVRGNHIASQRLLPEDLKNIRNGLSSILNDCGIEPDDSGDYATQVLESFIHVRSNHTGASYTVRINDILTADWEEDISAREARYENRDPVLAIAAVSDQVGPNAQVAAAGAAIAHPFYRGQQGA